MYTTCLFCNGDLGKNEVVEAFPVGRRLAFDAAKGRLWVVCRKCERWNLTPLEERWEAIEQCERQFSSTKLRVSTDNVGLARVSEGLELVRIGAPQRPEMAAWRYGDQFGRRRRRFFAYAAGAVAIGGALVVAGPVAGLVSTGLLGQAGNFVNIANAAYRKRKKLRLPLADGGSVQTNLLLATQSRLVLDGDVPVLEAKMEELESGFWKGVAHGVPITLRGEDAIRAAGVILPHVNQSGGGEAQVRSAVRMLEDAPSIEALYRDVARDAKARFAASSFQWGDPGHLRKMPAPLRLALEMAAHEEQERRALEGELAELERMWQQAEEIAGIADTLLVEDPVQRALRRLKGGD